MGLCQIGLSVTRRAVFGLLLVTAPVTTGACHPFKGAEHNRSPLVILPDPTVMIMFASDSNGIYRAEGCQRRGDVARRIGIVAGARAQGMPLVHVNLGDFVAMAKSPGGKSAARHIASSEALLVSLPKPQLDGFVPGETELSLGRQNLLRIIEANDITALAANVVGPDRRPLFGIYAVTRRRGVRVGLVGIVEPAARTLPSLEADGYSFEKAEPALARAVEL